MARAYRILGGVVIGLGGLLAAGCASGRTAGVGAGAPGPLLATQTEDLAAVVRSQQPETAPAPFTASSAVKPALALPAPQTHLLPAGNPLLPAAASLNAQQAAALLDSSEVRVKVRAWVNGQPIFDEELMQAVGPFLNQLARLPEPQRTEKMVEVFDRALEQMIDQEVLYQSAVRRLEKGNPKALEKLRQAVDQDYEKQLKKMRAAGVSEEHIREGGHVARRMMERNIISQEYARSMISGFVQQQVTLEAIKTYYEAHKNEFQTVDKVQWQDVFIAVGPKHPTVADAHRFADELIARCRTGEDFAKVLTYDEGDSKFRGGEGLGQRRGEVRPPELEPYLFQLKDGQIGPVVELSTGVHVFRLVKREYAGQLPLSEKTQQAIRRKLENQIAEREYKHLVREVRERAVVRYVREAK